MRISYPKPETLSSANGSKTKASPITLIVTLGVIVIVGGIGYVFFKNASTQEPANVNNAVPSRVETPPVPLYAPQDGMKLCNDRIADIKTADGQKKRTECYTAVMTLFGTSEICAMQILDAQSMALCEQAKKEFTSILGDKAPVQIAPIALPVFLPNLDSTSGSSGSTNSQVNTNTAPNTNVQNGSSSNENTNANTNATVTNGNTNTNANTNASLPADTSTDQDSDVDTDENTDQTDAGSGVILCRNEEGEVVLLEHTNNCY